MTPGGGLATQYAPPLDLPFRFMATALAWLAVLTVVYPWHTPLLLGSFYDPHLLTFVHVNTLGVIAATIFGASYQMLPVVLGVSIASVRLARLSWWLYLPSLPLFLAGLSQGWLVPLALGGTLLFGAIGLHVGIVLVTLARAPYRDVVFWHLLTSVIGLAAAASLGLLLAFSKHVGFLGEFALSILAAHATLMVGAWVAPLLMGVAYRLVGMFTLTEDKLHASWAWAGLACTAGGAWLLAAGLFAFDRRIELVGALGLLAGVSLFAVQLLRLYQVRRRHQFDVHIPFVLIAAAFGVPSWKSARFTCRPFWEPGVLPSGSPWLSTHQNPCLPSLHPTCRLGRIGGTSPSWTAFVAFWSTRLTGACDSPVAIAKT